jgi:hypothetical protein
METSEKASAFSRKHIQSKYKFAGYASTNRSQMSFWSSDNDEDSGQWMFLLD